jgi:putative transposase
MAAMRYVERNPVRAKMVNRPWQWKWSSAAAHIGGTDEMVDVIEIKESVGVSMESWREHIDSDDNAPDVETIRRHTMTGRPLGRDGFIVALSRKLGRVIRVLQRGRPRKDLNK